MLITLVGKIFLKGISAGSGGIGTKPGYREPVVVIGICNGFFPTRNFKTKRIVFAECGE